MNTAQGMLAKYGTTIVAAVCAFIIAASPAAIEGKPVRVILWTGLSVAAGYVKGKLDAPPGKEP